MLAESNPTLRRQSGAQAVYAQLREQIISGGLQPATRVTEPELATALGVSRTPVREALRLLLAEDLVEQLPTGGVRVAPVDVADLRRIYDVRARLEGLLARDACVRMSDGDLAGLDRLLERMDRLSDDEEEVLRLGRDFHGLIAQVADNRWCSALLRQIRGHVDRYRSLSTREHGRPGQAVAEHRVVFDALHSGDPERAEVTMRDHIEHSAASALRAAQAIS